MLASITHTIWVAFVVDDIHTGGLDEQSECYEYSTNKEVLDWNVCSPQTTNTKHKQIFCFVLIIFQVSPGNFSGWTFPHGSPLALKFLILWVCKQFAYLGLPWLDILPSYFPHWFLISLKLVFCEWNRDTPPLPNCKDWKENDKKQIPMVKACWSNELFLFGRDNWQLCLSVRDTIILKTMQLC